MRLFIAINLPAETRAQIVAATRSLRESALPVRWVEPAAYHLTMKFLGEVSDVIAENVSAAIASVASRQHPFTLRLHGAGAFPNPRRPTVWWLGIDPSAPLAALQQDVERGIAPLGFPTEQRPFAPHLTLGRTARDVRPGALAGADAQLQAVAFDRTITIDSLDLMRSHLSPRGARYERVFAAPLRP